MKFLKRAAAGVLAGVIGLSAMCFSVSAYGKDDNFAFNFNVPGNQDWGYINYTEKRETDSVKTPWKVNFTYSAEGDHATMQFFLLNNNWFNFFKYSDYKDVIRGSGNKYFKAYDTACNGVDVRIGARNNNYVSNNYIIGGYWDEETAYHPFDD